MADDDAGTTAQGDKHYDKKPVSATANVETPGQSDQPYNPPDGELFTNTSAVSVGGGRGYSATDGDGQRKRDRVRQKVEHVKDRARTENSENKSKLRKAFGLRVRQLLRRPRGPGWLSRTWCYCMSTHAPNSHDLQCLICPEYFRSFSCLARGAVCSVG